MNAAIYVRVSTDKQEAEGYSLGTQEAACRKYAAEQGYAVAEVYREVHTASELYERPELARCREAMARGEYAALICYDPDRFSRNQVHTALLQDFCERAGVALKFALFDFEQSATGRFLLNARAFAAELELEKIKERTMRGKRARAESGKLLPGCRALYGYRYTPDRTAYAIDPDTAPIVRRIFADMASGVTLRALSAALSAESVPTTSGRAKFWHPSTVRWVATNPAYTGEATAWRFTVRKDRQRGTETVVLRPESEQVALPAGTVPPLVDADTFLAVQERLRLNKVRAVRNNRNPQAALLRAGFARCGYCGRALAAETAPQGVRYGCGGGRTDAGPCNHGMLAHLLDSAVWERVEALLTKPETVARQLADRHTADPTSGDAATVDRALAAVARQQANLGRTVALLDDEDAAAPLVAELRALGARKRQLEQEREVLGCRREE